MKRLPSLLLGALTLLPVSAHAQMQTGSSMKDYDKVFRLPPRSTRPAFEAFLVNANQPGCIYYPGQTPELTFQVQNLSDQPLIADATLEIIGYGTRGIPGDIWRPEVFSVDTTPGGTLHLSLPAKGWRNYTQKITIPERFGGYAVILDAGSRGRTVVATMVRAIEPQVPLVRFPHQALDGVAPALLERVGVHAVRWGTSFASPSHPNYARQMADIERQLQDYQKHHITVVVEIGAGDAYQQATGQPRPHLDAQGVMQDGKMDFAWLPAEDQNLKTFVKTIVSRYGWPKGPVTGLKLWNEPWEGTSISGWQADMLRFREIHKAMGEAVHEANREAGVNVLVGGTDSSTNTFDKLFPDDSDEFSRYFDFCSIHYQGMQAPTLYRKWIERKEGNGRVLIWDTESWVANSDDRIGAVVASNRAAGYDRAMGIYIGNVFTVNNFGYGPNARFFQEDGRQVERPIYFQSWAPAAAVCASQFLIGERAFKEILFKNGLPWVYCFHGMDNNPDDGTVVILGDLGAVFASPQQPLFRNVRSLAELDSPSPDGSPQPFRNASITVAADPDFTLYDFFANPVPSQDGKYVIPLDARGFYLRANSARAGSFRKLTQAVSAGRIAGLEAVEIKIADFLEPIGPISQLRLIVTNVLNRPIAGRFSAEIAGTQATSDSINLDANQTLTIQIPVSGLKAAPDNRYAVAVRFKGDSGERAEERDTLCVNQVTRRTIKVDGNLEDWQQVLPLAAK